jgi:hypothetical protein
MHRICPAVAACAWLMTSPAYAQAVDRNGVPFRLWDVAAGGGLHFEDSSAIDGHRREFGSWRGTGAVGWQGGRYWTSHLKTEAGVLYAAPDDAFGAEPVVAPDGAMGFLTYHVHTRMTHLNGAFTYQFFENVFAHPYVSAGARIGVGSSHLTRESYYATSYPRGVVTSPIPPREERRTILQARPFASAGFKSYFTERSFLRSELSAAFGSRGLAQLSIGLGFGVDF